MIRFKRETKDDHLVIHVRSEETKKALTILFDEMKDVNYKGTLDRHQLKLLEDDAHQKKLDHYVSASIGM